MVLLVYFVSQTVAALVAIILKVASSGVDLSSALETLASDGMVNSIAILASTALGAGLVFLFVKIRGGISISEYLGFKKIGWRAILLIIALVIALLALVIIAGPYLSGEGDSDLTTELYRSSVFPPLLWLAVALAAPFFEELFFRGFLFAGIRASRLGAVGAVVITAVLWASLHLQYSVFGMAQILLLGLVMGVVRHKTDSLWSSLMMHVMWNGFSLAAVALYLAGGGG